MHMPSLCVKRDRVAGVDVELAVRISPALHHLFLSVVTHLKSCFVDVLKPLHALRDVLISEHVHCHHSIENGRWQL